MLQVEVHCAVNMQKTGWCAIRTRLAENFTLPLLESSQGRLLCGDWLCGGCWMGLGYVVFLKESDYVDVVGRRWLW